MIYRKLYITVIIRVIGIVINSFVLALVWFSYRDILIIANLVVVLIIQTWLLIRKLNSLNYDLENFFKSVRNNDSSVKFKSKRKNDYPELYAQFDLVNRDIQKIKIENENQNQYFKVLVEHVGIGLLSFDKKGKVLLFNRAAKELFNKIHLFHISDLDRIQEGLAELIENLTPSEQKLFSIYRNHELIQLSLKATDLKMTDQNIKLVSFQNIKNELDEKELDSWQKLIRVLTHEIMNSISPVNSSISTLVDMYADKVSDGNVDINHMDNEMIEDTIEGLDIIEERISGMVKFVSRFRDLTLLPTPVFTEVNLTVKIQSLIKLLKDDLNKANIELTLSYPNNNVKVTADSSMIDQIVINLMMNSIQALNDRENKKIELRIGINHQNKPFIELEDNGCGINEECQSEVFVPFFTTKKNGTGIGLSLSRQLMRLHGGTLTFKSEPDVYTQFTIQF